MTKITFQDGSEITTYEPIEDKEAFEESVRKNVLDVVKIEYYERADAV